MFSRVDGLIATHAKNHFGRSIVVEMAELDTWLQHPVLNAIPNATFDGGSQKMDKGRTARSANTDLPFFRRYWIWLLGLCLLTIVVVVFVAFRHYNFGKSTKGEGVVVQKDPEIDRLAKAINCNVLNVRNDLKNLGFEDADFNDISRQMVDRPGYGKYFAVKNYDQFSSLEEHMRVLFDKEVNSGNDTINIIKKRLDSIKISIGNINNAKSMIDQVAGVGGSKSNEVQIAFLGKVLAQKIVFNSSKVSSNCFLSVDDLEVLRIVVDLPFSELGANASDDFSRKLDALRKLDSPKDNIGKTAEVLECYSKLRKSLLGVLN
jgi:hypothetical protein